MAQCKVKVNVAEGYDVIIGNGLMKDAGELIKQATGSSRVAVITDSNVAGLYADQLDRSLKKAGIESFRYVFKAGEEQKHLVTLTDILETLADNGFLRTDTIVALGGGVAGDMAGFAAAVYLRGVRYVQIPTTLLAAVDSSVGGKTAVDLKAGKNLAGAFKQPELVICDTDTLRTLPPHETANGMAETIKYGVLFSEELFALLENGAPDDMTEIIRQCVAMKGHIVEIDETEKNERRLLNLGHTFAHAIEKCSSFGISHGHAVAAGMAIIARAGEKMGITQKGTADRLEKILSAYQLPIGSDYSEQELAKAAMSDKKRAGGSITFVIPEKIGSCILKAEPVEKLEEYAAMGRKQA